MSDNLRLAFEKWYASFSPDDIPPAWQIQQNCYEDYGHHLA